MSYLKIQVYKIYEIKTTTKFEKDLKLMKKRGYDTKLLKEVIDILSKGENQKKNIKIIIYKEIIQDLKSAI